MSSLELLLLQEQVWFVLALMIAGALVGVANKRSGVLGGSIVLSAALMGYVFLLAGFITIPIHPAHLKDVKVFALGLSRTGTSSITVAFHALGFRAYHALPRLLRWDRASGDLLGLDKAWGDAYDGQTDVHPCLVFQELAEAYPGNQSVFILNRRDPKKWAKSMVKFAREIGPTFQAMQDLYDMNLPLVGVRPVNRLFKEIYGKDWREYNEEAWEQVYRDYESRVREYFQGDPRFHEIDITAGASWEELATILGVEKPSHLKGNIPKVDYMDLSATTQVIWQLEYLLEYFTHVLDMAGPSYIT